MSRKGIEDHVEQAKFRRVFCSHYRECLNRAVHEEIATFRCDDCKNFFEEQKKDAEYWLEQALRAAELVIEVFGLPPGPDEDRMVLRGPGAPLGSRVRKNPRGVKRVGDTRIWEAPRKSIVGHSGGVHPQDEAGRGVRSGSGAKPTPPRRRREDGGGANHNLRNFAN